MFNRLLAIWPKDYQRGSLGRDLLKGILRGHSILFLKNGEKILKIKFTSMIPF